MKIIYYVALPAIALIGLLWLAFLDHPVSWDSKILGLITVHPRSAPPLPECKEIVASLKSIEKLLRDDMSKLGELRRVASNFDVTYKHPDYTRYWLETGQTQSKDNWNKVTEQEKTMQEYVSKILPNIEKVYSSCSL